MGTRDLMKIPGVAEDDIRVSLLKGELNHKIQQGEITVICSDIDLLQFNLQQAQFLEAAGIQPESGIQIGIDQIVPGTISGGGALNFAFKQQQILVGSINGTNRVFTVPVPDKFINGPYQNNVFTIFVTHNGKALLQGYDYSISESNGVGTGYDTITLTFTPIPGRSVLEASYVVKV